MIFCVIDQAVVGKYDPFGTAFFGTQSINITLGVRAPILFRKQTFIIPEAASADTHARCIGLQRTAGPAQLFRFLFCNEIGGKAAVLVNVEGNILPGGISAVFRQECIVI